MKNKSHLIADVYKRLQVVRMLDSFADGGDCTDRADGDSGWRLSPI